MQNIDGIKCTLTFPVNGDKESISIYQIPCLVGFLYEPFIPGTNLDPPEGHSVEIKRVLYEDQDVTKFCNTEELEQEILEKEFQL